MNPRDEDLWRWRESSADPRALTARAADLVDAVRAVPPLPPEALARIKSGVLARRPTRAGRGLPLGLRLAVLTGFVLASVATARGTMMLWHRFVARPITPLAAKPEARRIAAARPRSAPVVVEELAPREEPAPPAPVPARVHKTPVATRAPEKTVEAEPSSARDEAHDEAQLLGRAISRLRQARDPRGALAVLDQYDQAFPRGVLRPEALRARLEAVIQMDDRKTALALLDGNGAGGGIYSGRLGAELLLTRAELRASAGRYADALADFDRLLAPAAPALPADLAGRSLYGRAICLGHLGRDARARADLAAYQARFPDGRFAAEVARLLRPQSSSLGHP